MKVTAVIVTYNRLDLLKECIQSLKEQTIALNEIIVVNNNSSDGTTEWLQNQEGLTVIKQENLGGAGGQYTGIKAALQNNADWIWCMDDDAMPYPDALEKLLPFCNVDNVAALTCTVIDKQGEISYIHRGNFNYKKLIFHSGNQPILNEYYNKKSVEIGYGSFVGIMLNKKSIEKVGLPKKEFFIHYDDIEYSLRLNKIGKLLLIPESKILHKEEASSQFFYKKVFGKERLRIKFDKLWLRYYSIRNLVWLVKTNYGKKGFAYFILFLYYIKSFSGIILFDDKKVKRIKFLTSAFMDGLSSTFNNGHEYITKRTKLYS